MLVFRGAAASDQRVTSASATMGGDDIQAIMAVMRLETDEAGADAPRLLWLRELAELNDVVGLSVEAAHDLLIEAGGRAQACLLSPPQLASLRFHRAPA